MKPKRSCLRSVPLLPLCVLALGAGTAAARGSQVVADAAHLDDSSPQPHSIQTSAGGQADIVVRRYSLRDVLPAIDPEVRKQKLFIAPGLDGWAVDDAGFGASDLRPDVDLDVVSDLLSQVLGDDLRFEGRGLEIEGDGSLLLMAPQNVQAKAQKILSALAKSMGAHARVAIDVLTLDSQVLPFPKEARMPIADANRLMKLALDRGASHVHHEMVLTPGNTSVSDMTRPLALIVDYNVEIAQQSAIGDPIRTTIELGQRITARGTPLGKTLRIAVMLRSCDLRGEVRERPLGMNIQIANEAKGISYADGPVSIQQAEVVEQAYGFSGDLDAGTALVCLSELNLGDLVRSQLVVLRALDVAGAALSQTPLAPNPRALLVVNSEAFSTPRVDLWMANGEWGDEPPVWVPFLYGRALAEPPPILEDILSNQFTLARSFGPWALIVSDPAWDRDEDANLRALTDGWPSPSGTRTLAVELSASGSGAAVPVRALLPCRSGQQAGIVVGTARNVIWDYDVEVAQMASVADPIVTSEFSGLGAILTPGTGTKLAAQALCRIPSGAPQVFEVDAMPFRFFDSQRHDLLRVRARQGLDERGSTSFGATASNADNQSLLLSVTVR